MKKVTLILCILLLSVNGFSQRITDKLDRGLVAVKVSGGVFVSWRIFAEEYYDVDYNLYRNGVKVNSEPLSVSNYLDKSGTSSSTYTVAPIIERAEQAPCKAVSVWSNQYIDVAMPAAYDRNGNVVSNTDGYILNDVSLADVTGDGVTEFIIKRNYVGSDLNTTANKTKFHHYECVDMSGKRLWWIDLGPNMMAGPDEQWDCVAYDWDMDGKAECVMRGADNMIIHTASGKTINVGNMSYVAPRDQYTCNGAEYLIYFNGETGEPYDWDGVSENYTPMAFPLPRFETGESDYGTVWGKAGDGGHRSSKFYFGAPVLDGRKASIFLGRGCYTRHKMCALDVDPITHSLTQRWRWNQYSGGSWFGQGFHNFGIADVDWDGRDEIVFGSMVIDDNGKGLSTTGLGHGDAQHCRDFDPYRHGQEIFTCNEDNPSMNYRNATTSKLYYRLQSTSDDGRALCGNFTNAYPGSVGRSTQSGMVSTVADKPISELGDLIVWSDLNFRIFWDGDLLDEVLNSPGTEREAKVEKPGTNPSRIFTSSGCKMNNDSKNNPGATGDILGDWREEMVLRTSDNANLRIYTTTATTTHRLYTLWHDHQYRNAMVWQCVGYNQPPHVSYFTGEMEGITIAPPPLTMTGRIEVKNGETIGTSLNGKHIIVCETNNTNITIENGATPSVATFNIPSWVQGNTNNNNIVYDKFTCNVSGAPFVGATRLVKQGDGILNLPKVEMAHTGNTDIWAGTVNFDGVLKYSDLWLNRFAILNSAGGIFKSIKMDYASELRPGGKDAKGELTATDLTLGFGSRIIFDIYNENLAADLLKLSSLIIETKNWDYGPEYLTPVFEFNPHMGNNAEIAVGKYLLAEVANCTGDISEIKLEGLDNTKKNYLMIEDGKLYLVIENLRGAGSIIWNGLSSNIWDVASSENFTLATNSTATCEVFVNGDKVRFDDTANKYALEINSEIEADSIVVDNTKAYTFSGIGSIIGNTILVKRGTGMLTIKTDNSYTGGTRISGGTLSISSLSNENQAMGNLGGVVSSGSKFVIENGATLSSTASVQMGSPITLETPQGGVISNSGDFIMNKIFTGTKLTKRGGGWMKLHANNTALDTFVIAGGTVQCISCTRPGKVVVFQNGTLSENGGSSFGVHVTGTGVWNTANNSTYTNKVTGNGKLTVYCNTVKGDTWYATRTPIQMNLSQFTGTLVPQAVYAADGRFTLDASTGIPNGTMNIPSGIIVQNTGKTYTIGKLTGSGTLGATCSFSQSAPTGINTWRVGCDENFTFDGTITGDNTVFMKIGSGKMTLTGASNHGGATRIEAGQLHLNSKALLGTGNLIIAQEALLTGTTVSGTPLTNDLITVNGTIQPGNTETALIGTIEFDNKNVTFNKNSILRIGLRRCATATNTGGTSIQGINKLTMNGTLSVHLGSTYKPVEGDSMRVWEAASFAGTPTFDLPDLPIGYFWDTSRINEGLLFVGYDPTGIENVEADEEVEVTVVSTGGIFMDKFVCPLRSVKETFRQKALPSGIYMLHIKAANGFTVQKVMK